LERQRTSTGGPTLVPGNSQIIGEFRISRDEQPHLVITAGRSGFSDQSAVKSMANYARWAVKQLGTARRAAHFGIADSSQKVPGRLDGNSESSRTAPEVVAREALREVVRSEAIQNDPALKMVVSQAAAMVETALNYNEETLRLYAQLATSGIAAT